MSDGFLTTLRPWSPPGPVAAAAFASWASPVILQGPVGSGKTGTYIWKAISGTLMQNPWADGVRRARLMVLRDDYRRLWSNFIPSWFEWLPQDDPTNGIRWVGSRGGPAMQSIAIKTSAGILAELEVHFMALGDDASEQAMEAFFSGLPFTWIWFNEWHTIPQNAHAKAFQRVGRYPRAADAVVVGPGVWGDCNAPIVETFHHELITSGKLKPGVHYFRQPGAREPGAENVTNLYPGYYASQIANMPPHEIERKIDNRFGRRLDGEPVFAFDDNALVAPNPLAPDYRRTLLYGVDAGLDPAIVLGQRMADGQLRRLAEVVTLKHGVGAKRFGEAVLVLLNTPRFAPFLADRTIRGYGDPAAFFGNDREDEDDAHWMDRFARAAGLTGDMRPRPAPSNSRTPREQAVRDTLSVDEGQPRALFDPVAVPMLRRAYNGGYRFRKLRTSGDDRYDPEPEKNIYSPVADADQYLAMMEGGYERALGRDRAADGNAVLALMEQRGLIAPRGSDRRRGPATALTI